MQPSLLTIEQSATAQGVLLRPLGDIDMAHSPTLRARLLEAFRATPAPKRVVIDLGKVSYMDSSGVATLVEALQNARRGGAALVLAAPTPRVRGIFDISKLSTVFTIVSTPEEAWTA